MTDREMLELAAKAAGIELKWGGPDGDMARRTDNWNYWNPLTDDGDALRLAVKLRLSVINDGVVCVVRTELSRNKGVIESLSTDSFAATRRAIVRAAAEIGKSME